jgi:hypothetical protein
MPRAPVERRTEVEAIVLCAEEKPSQKTLDALRAPEIGKRVSPQRGERVAIMMIGRSVAPTEIERLIETRRRGTKRAQRNHHRQIKRLKKSKREVATSTETEISQKSEEVAAVNPRGCSSHPALFFTPLPDENHQRGELRMIPNQDTVAAVTATTSAETRIDRRRSATEMIERTILIHITPI